MNAPNVLQMSWLDSGYQNEVGFAWVADDIKEILHTEDEALIRQVTLANLEDVLRDGLMEVLDLGQEEGIVVMDLSTAEAMAECNRIWDEVGLKDLFLTTIYFRTTDKGEKLLRSFLGEGSSGDGK